MIFTLYLSEQLFCSTRALYVQQELMRVHIVSLTECTDTKLHDGTIVENLEQKQIMNIYLFIHLVHQHTL